LPPQEDTGDIDIKIISQLSLLMKAIAPEVRLYLLGIQIVLVIGTLVVSSKYAISIVKEFSTIQDASVSIIWLVGGVLAVIVVYWLISKLRGILQNISKG
jgi:hypothetical protein|tara:strand:- start:146 stop:445 length:300 start_codon:yes stop_codon:yes gene_type:complete